MVRLSSLIETGESIKNGLKFVPVPRGIIRTYSLYSLADRDAYFNWKELALRFLQLYSPGDAPRFTEYSVKFEDCYQPSYVSNMIGILRACEALPSEKMYEAESANDRESEIEKVIGLEQTYTIERDMSGVNSSQAIDAFHFWHAEACVLFDKWFYPSDEDFSKFQSIDGGGNGYTLNNEYNRIYSPYRKLMSRLEEGRDIKSVHQSRPSTRPMAKEGTPSKKLSIFISYSHSDKRWLEKLKKQLKVLLKYSESIEYWEDTKLRGGDKWKEEITAAIEKANVAILLVSTDFLASDFISNDELPPILRKAQEEGTCILPLIVAPCEYEISELGDFQAVNSPDKTLADLGKDEAAIERVFLELNKCIKGLLV